MNNASDINIEQKSVLKKNSPKRMKRAASKELAQKSTTTKAQEAIKKEHEKCKELKKHKSSVKKRDGALRKYALKQLKKKEKLRGH